MSVVVREEPQIRATGRVLAPDRRLQALLVLAGSTVGLWFWSAVLRGRVHPAAVGLILSVLVCGSVFMLTGVAGIRRSCSDASGSQWFAASPWLGFAALVVAFVPEYLIGHPLWWRSAILFTCAAALSLSLLRISNSRPLRFAFAENHGATILAVFACAYFSVTTAIALWKLHVLAYIGLDISYFTQAFYTTLHGQFFHANVIQDRLYAQPVQSDFAAHNSPILLAILPFFYLHASAATLLVVRNVFMALCAWPAYRLGRRLFSPSLSALAGVTFLFVPTVLFQSTFDLAIFSISAFFLLFVFDSYVAGDLRRFVLCSALALCVREDLVLVIAGLALLAVIQRRDKWWVIFPAVLSVVWAGISWKLVMPHFLHGTPLMVQSCFSHLGPNSVAIARNVAAHPGSTLFARGDLVYIKQLITSTGGLFVFCAPVALLSAPFLLINLLSGSGMCFTTILIFFHYSVVPAVLLWIASLLGLSKLSARLAAGNSRANLQFAGLAAMLFLSIASVAFVVEPSDVHALKIESWQAEARQVAATIPVGSAVAAPRYLLPLLANRDNIYEVHRLADYHDPHPQYVIVDLNWERMQSPEQFRSTYNAMLAKLAEDPSAQLLYQSSNYRVYHVSTNHLVSLLNVNPGVACND